MKKANTVGDAVVDAVVGWYRSHLDRDDGRAKAVRAMLKRCESPTDALAIEETFVLNARLKECGQSPGSDQLALLATTFARLKELEGNKLAATFGKRTNDKGPRVLSALRFQSLIRTRSHRELMTPMRRSLAHLGSHPACDGSALAKDLYFWSDCVRDRWCFQYFATQPD